MHRILLRPLEDSLPQLIAQDNGGGAQALEQYRSISCMVVAMVMAATASSPCARMPENTWWCPAP